MKIALGANQKLWFLDGLVSFQLRERTGMHSQIAPLRRQGVELFNTGLCS